MEKTGMHGKILCLDLDGPIIECKGRYFELYRNLLKDLGGDPIPIEKYWGYKKERVPEIDILRESQLSPDKFGEYARLRTSQIEESHFLLHDQLQPHAHETLSLLRHRYEKMVLITLRRNRANLEEQLSRYEISKYFDYILSGFSDRIPGWEVKYNLFIENLPAKYHSVPTGYFVGDTETDLLAGQKLGLMTAGVLSGIRSRSVLEKYRPDFIYKNLKDFASQPL